MATVETNYCYRHPDRPTGLSCSECGRPICTECMVFAAVGIKCPECAGQPTGIKKATTRAKSVASTGTGALVTKTLIGINVAVFLLEISQGDPTSVGNEIFRKYALLGPAVADGEWYRLVTAGFLHASITHILFNMVMLWWFGSSLEGFLGRSRFLTIYLVSLIAGSAGALLLDSNSYTVGASGAVFGVLGAGVVLERRGFPVFGGSALIIVLLNLALGFFTPGILVPRRWISNCVIPAARRRSRPACES